MKLQDVRDNRNKHDLLIFTGEKNTKVGEEKWDYDEVMGKHGLDRDQTRCDPLVTQVGLRADNPLP